MARIRDISSYKTFALAAGWELAGVSPGAAAAPDDLAQIQTEWMPASVPGTVAAALQAQGRWRLGSADDFDATDWWYRCRFAGPPAAPGCLTYLRLEGLATIAEVFCNGVRILQSENMYLAHAVDVTQLLRADNELCIVFRSLARLLQERRPRPRWRTRLVEPQQLRFFRTTLLGRMPSFCPPVAPIGPWRPIVLEQRDGVRDMEMQLVTGEEVGVVSARLRVQPLAGREVRGARLIVGGKQAALRCETDGDGALQLSGTLRLRDAAPWWPHTHGPQPLYEPKVVMQLGTQEIAVRGGRLGFRQLALHTGAGDDFALHINGAAIFCRGACWTPLDIVGLGASPGAYRQALETVRDAGMNMLRLPGNMLYEDREFYALCDELGILVWQDFMFANMDYPSGDPRFTASVAAEARQLLDGLQQSPALTVLCGGSEVEQQAAMLGLPRDTWSSALFQQILPQACRALRPDVPYVPSSPCGGELPFQVNTGVAHYYGVGAYLRPLDDARRCELRFAAECLAFANVPEESTVEASFKGATAVVHHPQWKARVPRDVGAGWDFEDVRDYYLRLLFGVDPMALRYSDPQRYLALSRVVTGEVMAHTFAEWRRRRASCRGALVWLLRDLWPGAGWGLIDSLGTPKAAYYYLKRACKPLSLSITDEGCNGLYLHAANESAQQRDVTLQAALYRHGEIKIADGKISTALAPRDNAEIPLNRLFTGFVDTSYAYRFGPPSHDLVVATLVETSTGAVHDTAFFFPVGFPAAAHTELGLTVTVSRAQGRAFQLDIRTQKYAQSVVISAPGFLPDDNHFHLEPEGRRTIALRPQGPEVRLQGTLTALNTLTTPVHFLEARS